MKAEIKLIRVDNRLVHGQVGMSWTNSLDVDTIVVIDDEGVNDISSQKLMMSIAKAADVQLRFYSIEDFMEVMFKNESSQKLCIVVKTIQIAKQLAQRGLPAQRLNLGNIHYERGRMPFNKKVYLTKEDVEDLNYLNQKGYSVFYQDVPGSPIEKIEELHYESLIRR